MKVFVTGASGHIGSALLPHLLSRGHEVIALARSDKSEQSLQQPGVEVRRGELQDRATLQSAARDADGIVHLAFNHDFSDFPGAVQQDRTTIATIGAALSGSGKPFLVTGTIPTTLGRATTENDDPDEGSGLSGRDVCARDALRLQEQDVRVTVVRLPHSVHAAGGRGGFGGALVQLARQSGRSGYVADGSARWPAVHVGDAAALFALALEKGAPGTVLHAVGDEGVRFLDMADAIGKSLEVPVVEVPPEALGFLGALATTDKPASSALTQQRLGWRPVGPSLLDDILSPA